MLAQMEQQGNVVRVGRFPNQSAVVQRQPGVKNVISDNGGDVKQNLDRLCRDVIVEIHLMKTARIDGVERSTAVLCRLDTLNSKTPHHSRRTGNR